MEGRGVEPCGASAYMLSMPRHSAFDWLSRVVMLVLAGMITLSIIGSIAAIPSGTIEGRIGIDQPQPPVPQPVPAETAPPAPQAVEGERVEPGTGTRGASGAGAIAPPPPEEDDAERWLEAITYALLALVGLAALGTLILWRGLKERRRIADALESISLRQAG